MIRFTHIHRIDEYKRSSLCELLLSAPQSYLRSGYYSYQVWPIARPIPRYLASQPVSHYPFRQRLYPYQTLKLVSSMKHKNHSARRKSTKIIILETRAFGTTIHSSRTFIALVCVTTKLMADKMSAFLLQKNVQLIKIVLQYSR